MKLVAGLLVLAGIAAPAARGTDAERHFLYVAAPGIRNCFPSASSLGQ